eukprot:jgi/Undpi1/2983/HiC_scaffold_14.g06360.m1
MKAGDGASKSTQCLGTGPGLAEGMQGSTSPGNEISTMAAIGAVNGIVREELQKGLETPMPPTAFAGRAAVHLVPLAVARLPSTVRQAQVPHARAPLVCERHAGLERRATADTAEGLERDLYLAKGAKVMLTKKLYQQVGLVNGIRGQVVELVFADDAPPPNLPLYVVVKFRGYSGGKWSSQERYRGCVPISPVDTTWQDGGTQVRTQLPLRLCWAITMRKSQGQTLEKAVIDLGPKEACTGLTFICLSRAKRLADLMVEPMSFDRIGKLGNSDTMKARLREEVWLVDVAQSTRGRICVIAGTPLTSAGFGRASTTSDVVLVTIATSFPCVKGDNNGGHPGFRDGVITGNTARITSESRGGGIAVNILLDTTESGKGAIAFSSLLATAESGEGALSSNTYFTTVDSGEDAVAADPVHLTAKSGDAIGTYHVHGKYYNDRG